MIDIPITIGKNEYKISADSRQWIIARKHIKTNKETGEKEIFYLNNFFYDDLGIMFKRLCEMKLRKEDAKTLEELKEKIDKVKNDILNTFDTAGLK